MWNVENFSILKEKIRQKAKKSLRFQKVFHTINILNVENFFPFIDNLRNCIILEKLKGENEVEIYQKK